MFYLLYYKLPANQFNRACCNIGCCFPLNNCTDNLFLYFSWIGFVLMVAVSINDSRGMFVCFNSPFTDFQNPIYWKCKSIVKQLFFFPLIVSDIYKAQRHKLSSHLTDLWVKSEHFSSFRSQTGKPLWPSI